MRTASRQATGMRALNAPRPRARGRVPPPPSPRGDRNVVLPDQRETSVTGCPLPFEAGLGLGQGLRCVRRVETERFDHDFHRSAVLVQRVCQPDHERCRRDRLGWAHQHHRGLSGALLGNQTEVLEALGEIGRRGRAPHAPHRGGATSRRHHVTDLGDRWRHLARVESQSLDADRPGMASRLERDHVAGDLDAFFARLHRQGGRGILGQTAKGLVDRGTAHDRRPYPASRVPARRRSRNLRSCGFVTSSRARW